MSSPKYESHFHGPVQGVVIGDNNTVTITYGNGQRHTIPFLAPPLPPYKLIGRDELLVELKQRLFAGDTLALSALNGLPGVGKTAVAVALAYDKEVLAHFTDGVLWAGVGRNADPLRHLGNWMAAVGIHDDLIKEAKDNKARVEMLKRFIGNKRLLLVVDDAWNAEDALWFKVGGPNCAHLLTTRQPKIAIDFGGEVGRTVVHELSLKEGLNLLRQFAESVVEEEPEEAKALVKAVDGLPLALMLMGKYLQKESYSQQPRRIRRVLERFKQVEERLQLEQPPVSVEHHPGLESVSISLHAVIAMTDEALDDEACTALRRLAVFPAKPVTFSEEAALTVTEAQSEALDTLFDYGLLEPGVKGRYTLHQTLSDYAALKLRQNPQGEQVIKDRHSVYYTGFVKQREEQLWSESPQNALNEIEMEIEHIRLMWKWAVKQEQQEIIRKIHYALQKFYKLRGRYDEGEAVFDLAVTTFCRHSVE